IAKNGRNKIATPLQTPIHFVDSQHCLRHVTANYLTADDFTRRNCDLWLAIPVEVRDTGCSQRVTLLVLNFQVEANRKPRLYSTVVLEDPQSIGKLPCAAVGVVANGNNFRVWIGVQICDGS